MPELTQALRDETEHLRARDQESISLHLKHAPGTVVASSALGASGAYCEAYHRLCRLIGYPAQDAQT